MSAEIAKAKEELNITSDIPLFLQHMVLSHHGQLEFGSPVMPLIKEAMLLYLIDNLDSKMVIIQKALETVNKGEFTNKIFALDNRMFYKH
jgi:3'-5' exoribonuclease